MPESNAAATAAYVVLLQPTDPTSLFTTELGEGRIAACIFSQLHQAMQFVKNAHGLAGVGITPMDVETLHHALEVRKRDGVTHVLLDPSAASGPSRADEIDEFMSSLKV